MATANNDNDNIAAAIDLASQWNNRVVQISGVGGRITVADDDEVKTKKIVGGATKFIIKASSEISGAVAFQVVAEPKEEEEAKKESSLESDESCPYYLTVQMYGDEHRQIASQMLAGIQEVNADNIPSIVDYAIARPTADSNFEGSGFNYSPMIVLPSQAPTKLQLFYLETPPGYQHPRSSNNRFGIKSLFGTYWRSQHWENTISQSPHLLRDETWTLHSTQQS